MQFVTVMNSRRTESRGASGVSRPGSWSTLQYFDTEPVDVVEGQRNTITAFPY
jgi:hypothetical protein